MKLVFASTFGFMVPVPPPQFGIQALVLIFGTLGPRIAADNSLNPITHACMVGKKETRKELTLAKKNVSWARNAF